MFSRMLTIFGLLSLTACGSPDTYGASSPAPEAPKSIVTYKTVCDRNTVSDGVYTYFIDFDGSIVLMPEHRHFNVIKADGHGCELYQIAGFVREGR